MKTERTEDRKVGEREASESGAVSRGKSPGILLLYCGNLSGFRITSLLLVNPQSLSRKLLLLIGTEPFPSLDPFAFRRVEAHGDGTCLSKATVLLLRSLDVRFQCDRRSTLVCCMPVCLYPVRNSLDQSHQDAGSPLSVFPLFKHAGGQDFSDGQIDGGVGEIAALSTRPL